ncbi:hypothetical protein [Streptomyces sp. SS8]
MLTASRAAWFGAAFVFALPAMLTMFGGSGLTRGTVWLQSTLFAVSIAAAVAVVFGRGPS